MKKTNRLQLMPTMTLLCCSQNSLVPYPENSGCQTTLEGRYISRQVYGCETRARYVEESYEPVVKQGVIGSHLLETVHGEDDVPIALWPMKSSPLVLKQ